MYIILFGSTTQMVTLPLRVVCCRSVAQTGGEQYVTMALAAQLKEELLVDSLDTVEVISVSVLKIIMFIYRYDQRHNIYILLHGH